MSRLPEHVIDEVRARTDIVDVVSRYVQLQRAGQRFKGLCPFHTEKTPSFHVDRSRQFFYCFGCQEGGNVFNFVMKIENLTFPEAVRHLADRVGVAVEEVDVSPEEAHRQREKEACYRANEVAKHFFVRMLFSPEGEGARAYLKERGLTKETVQAFGLGFAPDAWHRLGEYLRSEGVDEEVAVKAGLLGRGRSGTYDWFRGRIMFPIEDVRGRVVGFGGRTLGGDGAKYVNTAESPLFSKRLHLYGLNVAIRHFKNADHVILVEGYMDVIGLFQHGVGPAVASLGTAFTPEQARLMKRFTGNVILAYDADGAGRRATLRGLEILAQEGLNVRVARLPEGHDPDSLVREGGETAFRRLVEASVPLVEYQLTEAVRGLDLREVEGQVRAVRRVLPILDRIESAVAKEGYLAYAAGLVGVSARALAQELELYGRSRDSGARMPAPGRARHNLSRRRYTIRDLRSGSPAELPAREAAPSAASPEAESAPEPGDAAAGRRRVQATAAERSLLAWLLREPGRAVQVKESLGERPFGDERYNRILDWLLEQRDFGDEPEGVLSRLNDPELAAAAGEALAKEATAGGPFDAHLRKVVEQKLRRHLRNLEAKLSLLMNEDSVSAVEVGRLVVGYKRLRERLLGGVSRGRTS